MKGPFPGGYNSQEFIDELWKHLLAAMYAVDETLEEYQLEEVQLSCFGKSDTDEALAEQSHQFLFRNKHKAQIILLLTLLK